MPTTASACSLRDPDPLAVRLTGYIPHRPHPPQHAFLWLTCKEALYGGAAGGGKSDALLMAALQYADVPGYAALLLRKTYADLALPGAIMDRSKEWLMGTDARWSELDKRWTFPSGASLSFGYLQYERDRYRYQSAEFQFIGFDELTQFEQAEYEYLFSRLRKPADGPLSAVPLRMRAASNPGGRGHRWVKERFRPGHATPDPQRVFIPAKLDDNPSVDQRAYEAALAELDPQTRAQLRDGDWEARPPGSWVYDQAGIDAAEMLGARLDRERGGFEPSGGVIVLGIDWGENTHALVCWPMEAGGLYVTEEIVSTGGEPGEVTGRILHAAGLHGYPISEARYDAAGIQSMRTFTAQARTVQPHMRTVKVPFGNYKQGTVEYLRLLFRRAAEGKTTRVIAVSPRCETLLRQLRGLQFADPDAGRIDKGDDHGPDALIAAAAPVAARHRKT